MLLFSTGRCWNWGRRRKRLRSGIEIGLDSNCPTIVSWVPDHREILLSEMVRVSENLTIRPSPSFHTRRWGSFPNGYKFSVKIQTSTHTLPKSEEYRRLNFERTLPLTQRPSCDSSWPYNRCRLLQEAPQVEHKWWERPEMASSLSRDWQGCCSPNHRNPEPHMPDRRTHSHNDSYPHCYRCLKYISLIDDPENI